jgi:hypothetical protein
LRNEAIFPEKAAVLRVEGTEQKEKWLLWDQPISQS